MTAPIEPVVLCPATASSCICGLELGHEPPHECAKEERGGQWTGSDATCDFKPVRFPSAGGLGDVVNDLLFGGY